MSFAKNMGMPGSIRDEVIKKLEAVLIKLARRERRGTLTDSLGTESRNGGCRCV